MGGRASPFLRTQREALLPKIFLFPLRHLFSKPSGTDWENLGHRTEGRDHHPDTP